MREFWLDILPKIFEIVSFPLLAIATASIIALISNKKKDLLAKAKNEQTKKYIEMLDKTVTECVLATNQTYVNALKEQKAFDIDAQKKAFKLTYDAVMAILTDDAKEYLNEVIKDLNIYITTKIEAQVAVTKQQPA